MRYIGTNLYRFTLMRNMIQDFVFERYFGYINFFLCKCMLDSLVEGLCRENVKTLALVLVCWATGFTCKTSLYN